jgi:octaprenyl-diphosphate synthase
MPRWGYACPMPLTAPISADLLAVQELLATGLLRVEKAFDKQLRSDLPPVQNLCRHVESYRGKMLRPGLVILCGLAAGAKKGGQIPDQIGDEHVTIAAVCEMIHMATLVHDDVLDEADMRRKGTTVNRLSGNEVAVILGDYLFSAAYRLCSTLDSQHAALLIGQTGMTLCAGELLQLHHRENFSIDEPTYFEIVRRKTGSLIGVACRLGAWQSGADAPTAERFAEFGLRLGVAFQIQDDLLDLLGSELIVGKPTRKDIELGKLTLPVIHHLAAATPEQRGRTLLLLEDHVGFDSTAAKQLVEALESTRSLAHAAAKARELVEQAKAMLSPVADSPAKRLLLVMADQVVGRSS